MLIVRFEGGRAVGLASRKEAQEFWHEHKARGLAGTVFQSRNDWHYFEEVCVIADELTQSLGRKFLPVDHTVSTSPRFDVIEAPKIGDEASRGFNGDYYPVGKIVNISPGYKIITTCMNSEDKKLIKTWKFYRIGHTATWKEARGYFYLVHGERDERNPHF